MSIQLENVVIKKQKNGVNKNVKCEKLIKRLIIYLFLIHLLSSNSNVFFCHYNCYLIQTSSSIPINVAKANVKCCESWGTKNSMFLAWRELLQLACGKATT